MILFGLLLFLLAVRFILCFKDHSPLLYFVVELLMALVTALIFFTYP